MHWTRSVGRLAGVLLLAYATAFSTACQEKTGVLTPAQEQRLQSEGLVRRADDLIFRYTHDAGTREAGWEDRKA